MPPATGRLDLRPGRAIRRFRSELRLSLGWRFYSDVFRLIWDYKGYSLAIIAVTILQELSALWPVSLLGQFVDRLQTGDLGSVVWLFLGASLLYPGIVRGNTILRHRMFYATDCQKRIELTLEESDKNDCSDLEVAGTAHTRVVNAVSGITNAAYHILGSFAPVIIKVIVVAGNLLGYNRGLGLAYLGSLVVPALMTALFNSKMRVLRDAQYSVISRGSGIGVKTIAQSGDMATRAKFEETMNERTGILVALVSQSQWFLYMREVALVGSQFLVVFLALGMREQVGLTPGDFTKIVGYTTQVAAAFISTASVLDSIVSYSRAYYAYAQRL